MNTEDILDLKPPKADQRIAYGKDPNQFIDVRRPKQNPQRRCAFFIHGGFWRAKYDLTHAGHLCAALADHGWLSLNVEYRRVGNEGGGWPATFSDLREALQYVFTSAAQWKVDPENVVVLGHSAGGQLALALAGHDDRIKKAASLAGVLNLRTAYDLHLSNDAVVEFLGGPPFKMEEHYKEASPAELRIAAKQLIVHGQKDDVVPYSIGVDYVQQKKAKERISFLGLEEAGHFEVIDPRTEAWSQIVAGLDHL